MTTVQQALNYYNIINKDGVYDYKKAIALFNKEQNNSITLHYLGECYYYGRGVDKDIDRAIIYFQKASKMKYAKSFVYIAFLLQSENIYTDDRISQIHNLYLFGLRHSKTKEEIYFMTYNLILYMLDCLDNLKMNLKNIDEKISFLIDKIIEIVNESPDTKYILAELDARQSDNIYDHQLYKYINKLYASRILLDEIPYQSSLYLYKKAAEGGVVKASTQLANYYYTCKNYNEMVWWYWWSVYYDPNNKNEAIIEKISVNKLKKKYNLMTLNSRATKTVIVKRQTGDDNRAFLEYIKSVFLNALTDHYYELVYDKNLTKEETESIITSLVEIKKTTNTLYNRI